MKFKLPQSVMGIVMEEDEMEWANDIEKNAERKKNSLTWDRN